MRRPEIRQLRPVARHRLCDHAGLLPGALVAMRIYRFGPAGRVADGGPAPRRSVASRWREGAGGYSGPAQHDSDRAEIGALMDRDQITSRSKVPPSTRSFFRPSIWALVNGDRLAIIAEERQMQRHQRYGRRGPENVRKAQSSCRPG